MSGDEPGLPRRDFAVGLIVADDGTLLLQHRDANPGVPGAGLWGFFGGHLEHGERPSQAFLREMQEELGWRPRHFEPFTTREVHAPGWLGLSNVFAAHLDVPLRDLTLGEGQGMGLFAPDALPDSMVPGKGDVIREFAASAAYERMRRAYDSIFTTGLIVSHDGEFLLQDREDIPGISNPGMWSSFGGVLEPYETPEQGFLREMEEELGWRPRRCELHVATPYTKDGQARLAYVFRALLDQPLAGLTLGEGRGMALYPPNALPERTAPAHRLLIGTFAASPQYRALISS